MYSSRTRFKLNFRIEWICLFRIFFLVYPSWCSRNNKNREIEQYSSSHYRFQKLNDSLSVNRSLNCYVVANAIRVIVCVGEWCWIAADIQKLRMYGFDINIRFASFNQTLVFRMDCLMRKMPIFGHIKFSIVWKWEENNRIFWNELRRTSIK